VATEEEGDTVFERLEAGEDFATVAQELSIDQASKESGGDLGWFPEGLRGEEFDDVAFDLELGAISEPFSTAQGYWMIKVLEKEEREIADDARQQLAVNAFNSWLEAEMEEKVERKVDDDDLNKVHEWAMKRID
jgi:foldase protein PrsA